MRSREINGTSTRKSRVVVLVGGVGVHARWHVGNPLFFSSQVSHTRLNVFRPFSFSCSCSFRLTSATPSSAPHSGRTLCSCYRARARARVHPLSCALCCVCCCVLSYRKVHALGVFFALSCVVRHYNSTSKAHFARAFMCFLRGLFMPCRSFFFLWCWPSYRRTYSPG